MIQYLQFIILRCWMVQVFIPNIIMITVIELLDVIPKPNFS